MANKLGACLFFFFLVKLKVEVSVMRVINDSAHHWPSLPKKKKKVILLHSDISVSHWFKDFFTQNEVEVEQYMQFKTTSI